MTALLTAEGLESGYGPVRALRGLSLTVNEGEIVAVLGSNGAGKTTLMRTIMNQIRVTAGSVRFQGRPIHGVSTEDIVRLGLTLVPEGRDIFLRLSVLDNLRMGAYAIRDHRGTAQLLEELLDRFPILRERRAQLAGTLSGGEQQQLAICRALMSRPSLIMLDEPSLGLAPVMMDRVFELVSELRDRDGLTVLLVEQSISRALGVASRGYVLTRGEVSAEGSAEELHAIAHEVESAYLGGDTE